MRMYALAYEITKDSSLGNHHVVLQGEQSVQAKLLYCETVRLEMWVVFPVCNVKGIAFY